MLKKHLVFKAFLKGPLRTMKGAMADHGGPWRTMEDHGGPWRTMQGSGPAEGVLASYSFCFAKFGICNFCISAISALLPFTLPSPQGAGRIEPAERYTASPRSGISEIKKWGIDLGFFGSHFGARFV